MRRTLVALLFTGILVMAASGIAFGKGPTSARLSGPGIDSPIELRDPVGWPMSCEARCPHDPMVRLMEQTGIWYGVGDLPVPIDLPVGDLGNRYVLTWGRGGSPEGDIRQFVYPDADGGPVIHTPDQEALRGWGSGAVGWFRASDHLPETLASLGASLSDAAGGQPVVSGVRERVGPFAAIGAAVLLAMWAIRRRPISMQAERSS